MRPFSDIKEVREVSLSDKEAVAEMIQKGWEPLDVCKTYKRLLWWKRVDYIVMFGYRKSGVSYEKCFGSTPSGQPSMQNM